MAKVTKQGYLDAVAQKLKDPKVDAMLRYGPMGAGFAGTPLRDDMGMQVTFANMLQLAENLYDRQGGDLLAGAIATNFSQVGFGDVANVRTVGAVDVDIIVQSNSLVPFLSIDRAMANPIDTIYYSDLVAVDAYNGLDEGAVIVGNFQAPVNVSTSLKETKVIEGGSATLSEVPVKGSVVVKAVVDGVTYTGRDFTKDGTIYFDGGSLTGSVNYVSGAVTLTGTVTSASVTAMKAAMENTSGEGILKVRPDYKAVQLTTKPKQVIFQDNEATAMYMNRIMAQASKVSGISNYTTLQFSRIANLYTEDVNRDIIRAMYQMAVAAAGNDVAPNVLDYTEYTIKNSLAETKNDKVSQLFIDMQSGFMSDTGIAPTVAVVGTKAASILMNVPIRFVAGPNAMTALNGFIGTFNGMPVYRHNYIDQAIDSEGGVPTGYANIFMGAKLPDNSSGSLAYGEFLPLTKTAQALNFNNPMQNSTGWFSQVAVKTVDHAATKGLIHKNNAAHKKSAMTVKLNGMAD
jgi:hypothetical protein